MLDNKEIYLQSIVNHVYFAGSIRSFCTTIGLTFFRNNQDYIDRAITLGRRANTIVERALTLSYKALAEEILKTDVYITPYTKDIMQLTEKLFEVNLENHIDEDIQLLNSRENIEFNNVTMQKVDELNNDGLILVNDFNNFVTEIKRKLDGGELFSYLYPDFYQYMYDEIAVYGRDLERIISKKDYTDFYLREYAYYFNELLRQSAEFIRGFLDTSHQDVMDLATFYIDSFKSLTNKYLKNKNDESLSIETKKLVGEYKEFLTSILKRVLNSELYFITPPIVLDNFLTNINVYLFIIDYARGLSSKKMV